MRRAVLLSVVGAIAAGAVYFGFSSFGDKGSVDRLHESASLRMRQQADVRNVKGEDGAYSKSSSADGKVNVVTAVDVRDEFLASGDLYGLYQSLIVSDKPGAQLYAAAALSECSTLKGYFGIGSDAWSKFNSLVPEAAPDRAERVRVFQQMQDRCRGFSDSRLKLAFEGLERLFRKPSEDPFAGALAVLSRAGVPNSGVSKTEEFASAVKFALETRDPELLSALASAWMTAAPRHSELRPDEQALAFRYGWTLAISRSVQATPLGFVEMQNANCITGRGCGRTDVTETYRRFLSDRPSDRVTLIIATGEKLAPTFEAMLNDRQVLPFVGNRS